MNSLIYMLIKEGADLLIGRDLIRRSVQRIILIVALYALLSLLALSAIVFLYIFLDRWLSASLGGMAAAAILCGGNLLLIGLVLIGRVLLQPRRRTPAHKSIVQSLSANPNFGAGMAVGRSLGKSLRKAAPQIALGAAVVGLILGLRPSISNFFGRRTTSGKDGKAD